MDTQVRPVKRDWIATARTLSEALPYLQRYADAVVVVKFGGNAMGDDDAMAQFARDLVLLRQVGIHPVVVHGGGPMINAMLDKLGIESAFVRGKRVTDRATVEVVEMILSGLVNKRIVQAINDAGAIAGALKADRLLLLTDVAGVKDAGGEVMATLGSDRARDMIDDGTIKGG